MGSNPGVTTTLVILLSLLLQPTVHAEPTAPPPAPAEPSAREQANQLFRQAINEAKKGTSMSEEAQLLLRTALDRFRRAAGLFASYKIDLNVGLVLATMGRLAEAAKYHEEFLLRMEKDAPAEVVAGARKKLDELRRELASVRVNCSVPGAVIQLNGSNIGVVPQKMAHYVEPGTFVLMVSSEGHATHNRRLKLTRGEHEPITVKLISLAEQAKEQQEQAELIRRKDRGRLLGYSFLAAGAAMAVGAATLYGVGVSQGNEGQEGFNTAQSEKEQGQYEEQVNGAERLLIGGHVLIGLAAAATGVAVWQLVAASRIEADAGLPNVAPTVSAAVAPAPGGAAFTLSGAF